MNNTLRFEKKLRPNSVVAAGVLVFLSAMPLAVHYFNYYEWGLGYGLLVITAAMALMFGLLSGNNMIRRLVLILSVVALLDSSQMIVKGLGSTADKVGLTAGGIGIALNLTVIVVLLRQSTKEYFGVQER